MPQITKFNADQYHLLKAEALCAELMSNGLAFDDLAVRFIGAFRKSYRNDIEALEPAAGGERRLTISINRDGLYDNLPEGLFHQTKGGRHTSSLTNMVGEYRRYREEERQARKFFQPLEQELFRYAVQVEEEERKLRFGMLNGNLENEFYRFWNIDNGIPRRPASLLVLIMPWLKQIKGNMQLTAKALSIIVGKPVSAAVRIMEVFTGEGASFALGEQEVLLGIDSVCGNSVTEPNVQWVFTLSDMEEDELAQYTPDRPYGKLLRRFEELFIPMDVEACFEYHGFAAADVQHHEPILGYGFYL